uniref:Transcriptional regulator n=1 Tax=Mycena chlorophos TaxID=658473 RepID=A0ABQ0KYB3_MYCCL|nr:predicted protein [Mycena chlorophos]
MTALLDRPNQLLLAALKRAGRPISSDELIDELTALAMDHSWTTPQLAIFTRASIARRLVELERLGRVGVVSLQRDAGSRKKTPTYQPSDGFDPCAVVPPPQSNSTRKLLDARDKKPVEASPLDGMTPLQAAALFDCQDMVVEASLRMISHIQAGLSDFAATREKARARLLAAGLGQS